MPPAVTVENLSKAYRIGLKEEIPDTFFQAATGWMRKPFSNLRRLRRLNTFRSNGNGHSEEDIIWALRDVSFEVQEGEVVGIIGRNGAGKSTLLKVLSRITEPTSGCARIRGRVSSLLEVGTGFHPELSGRENIYMNGTILGMTKREIDRKFDEIVDFSGVEKFLDTPIKRYSSGMQVRLAFSVAAHLEPEILIIDEVLAVGDAEFQKRCLGKMQDVAGSGRTVLFVSHNMASITQLCSRALLVSNGVITKDDATSNVLDCYISQSSFDSCSLDDWCASSRPTPFYTSITLNGVALPGRVSVEQDEPISILVTGDPRGSVIRGFRVGIHLRALDGTHLFTVGTAFSDLDAIVVEKPLTLRCEISPPRLLPGTYIVDIGSQGNGGSLDQLKEVAHLVVTAPYMQRLSAPKYRKHGYFSPKAAWRLVDPLPHSSAELTG